MNSPLDVDFDFDFENRCIAALLADDGKDALFLSDTQPFSSSHLDVLAAVGEKRKYVLPSMLHGPSTKKQRTAAVALRDFAPGPNVMLTDRCTIDVMGADRVPKGRFHVTWRLLQHIQRATPRLVGGLCAQTNIWVQPTILAPNAKNDNATFLSHWFPGFSDALQQHRKHISYFYLTKAYRIALNKMKNDLLDAHLQHLIAEEQTIRKWTQEMFRCFKPIADSDSCVGVLCTILPLLEAPKELPCLDKFGKTGKIAGDVHAFWIRAIGSTEANVPHSLVKFVGMLAVTEHQLRQAGDQKLASCPHPVRALINSGVSDVEIMRVAQN